MNRLDPGKCSALPIHGFCSRNSFSLPNFSLNAKDMPRDIFRSGVTQCDSKYSGDTVNKFCCTSVVIPNRALHVVAYMDMNSSYD